MNIWGEKKRWKRGRRTIASLSLCSLFCSTLILSSTDALAAKVKLDAKGIPLVAPEMAIDQVAYSYQKKAIVKLKRLLINKKFQNQESELLLRLARLQQENADILFRIAHAQAYEAKKPISLSSYNEQMKQSIRALNELMAKYPSFDRTALALIMRGKAHSEVRMREQAIGDFMRVIKEFPNFEEVTSAYIAMAEFSIEEGKHDLAIQYLKNLIRDTKSPDYPYALFKMAWSYFYLNDIPQTMNFAKQYLQFHTNKIEGAKSKSDPSLAHANVVMRNEMLADVPLFYMRGFDLHLPEFPVSNALNYFRSMASNYSTNEIFEEMLLKFTKLLRSHGQEAALVNWKDQVIVGEAKRPVALEVFLLVYEDQLNKYRYKNVVESTKDMEKLFERSGGSYSFAPAYRFLLDVAGKVQKTIFEEKNSKGGQALSVVLINIYRTYLKIANPVDDPAVFRVHFNLAEAYANLEKYDLSIANYQWIIENAKRSKSLAQKSGVDISQAGLKAISMRYIDLKKKNLIPEDIKPRTVDEDSPKDINPKLNEWIGWITAVDQFGINKKDYDKSDFYFFEANRALYFHGWIHKALKQMMDFVRQNPESKYAIAMASLCLDTMISSKNWASANKLAHDYIDLNDWKDKAFKNRLATLSADTYFKVMEEKYTDNDYKAVLNMAEKIDTHYSKSNRRADFYNLVGRSALAAQQDDQAMIYFAKLVKEDPKSTHINSVLLLQAQNNESKYEFKRAATNYIQYLSLGKVKATAQELRNLREKVVSLAWLSGESAFQKQVLRNDRICASDIAKKCELYAILGVLDTAKEQRSKQDVAIAWKTVNTANISYEQKALSAIISMQSRKNFTMSEVINMTDMVVLGYSRLEPAAKFVATAGISEVLPQVFPILRREVSRIARVKADRAAIENRVAWIRKVEAIASKVSNMPWARVQAATLNTVADLYMDLANDLKGLPAPKGLAGDDLKAYQATMAEIAKPFEDDGKKLRTKTFEIASRAGIEDSTFHLIAESYFNENPDKREPILANGPLPQARSLTIEVLERLDSRGKWSRLNDRPDDPVMVLKVRWAQALLNQRWAQVAYFLSEAKSRSLIAPTVVQMMTSVALAAAGAKAEGLAQLEELRKQMTLELDEDERSNLTVVLIQQYLPTLARGKIRQLLEDVDEDEVIAGASLSTQEANLMVKWQGQEG